MEPRERESAVPGVADEAERERVFVRAQRSARRWYFAVVLLGVGGLFTTWGGAVRWQQCWRVGPACPEFEDHRLDIWPSYEDGELLAGARGVAEPLAYGALATFLGLVLLALVLRPRWLSVLSVLLAVGLVLRAGTYWQIALDPFAVEPGLWGTAPPGPWWYAVPTRAVSIGALALVGGVGLRLALREGREPSGANRVLQAVGWGAVTATGLAVSFWGLYAVPMLWSGSHDTPARQYNASGMTVLLAAEVLLWTLGRRHHEAVGMARRRPHGPPPAPRE